jgi:hypothetical protein
MRVIVIVAMALASSAASAQILDRILAVVDGSPIMISDVNGAVRLGLVPAPASKTDPDREALDAVIDRRLQLIEVNRYLPPEPAASAIDARLAETRKRFGSDAAFEAALNEAGLTLADLRAGLRDSLRIASYLEQRFGAAYQPGEEDVLAYFRAHEAELTGAGARSYAEVREEARRQLIASRTAALVRDWVAALRRRVDVTILPR